MSEPSRCKNQPMFSLQCFHQRKCISFPSLPVNSALTQRDSLVKKSSSGVCDPILILFFFFSWNGHRLSPRLTEPQYDSKDRGHSLYFTLGLFFRTQYMEIRLSIQTQDGDPAGAELLGKNEKCELRSCHRVSASCS